MKLSPSTIAANLNAAAAAEAEARLNSSSNNSGVGSRNAESTAVGGGNLFRGSSSVSQQHLQGNNSVAGGILLSPSSSVQMMSGSNHPLSMATPGNQPDASSSAEATNSQNQKLLQQHQTVVNMKRQAELQQQASRAANKNENAKQVSFETDPSTSTQNIPRDMLIVEEMLKEMGVTEYQPGVVTSLLDFAYSKFFMISFKFTKFSFACFQNTPERI